MQKKGLVEPIERFILGIIKYVKYGPDMMIHPCILNFKTFFGLGIQNFLSYILCSDIHL